jgi:hypothetical protein
VFAFADITMTMLAFVNLIALFLLFKVGMRVMRDYDDQRRSRRSRPRCSTRANLLIWTSTAQPGRPIHVCRCRQG